MVDLKNPELHEKILNINIADTLSAVRSRIVNAILLALSVLAAPAVAASIWRAKDIGWQNVIGVHIVFFPFILGAYILRKRLDYNLRAFILLGSTYFLGVLGLFNFGLVGNGIILSFITIVLATILYGAVTGITIAIITIAIIGITGICVTQGIINYDFDFNIYATSGTGWLLMFVFFGLFTLTVIAGLTQLFKALITAYEDLDLKNQELQTSHDKLETSIEKIQESSARFNRLAKSLKEDYAIFSQTPDYTFLYLSPATKAFFGVPPENCIGKRWQDIISLSPTMLEKTLNASKTLSQGKEPPALELTYLHPDKNSRTLEIRSWPVFDEKENVIAIEGIANNITLRIKTENDLRTTKEHLESLIDTSVDPIRITDSKGFLTRVNNAYAKLLGYDQAEMIGKHIDEFTPTEPGVYATISSDIVKIDSSFFQNYAEMVRKLHESGSYPSYDGFSLTRDNKVIITEESNSIIFDQNNEAIAAIGIVRDITARKQMEENLNRLATAVESADEMIIITDAKGKIEHTNPAFEHTTGYTHSEAKGNTMHFLESDKHEDSFYQDIRDTISREQSWKGHIINKRKDGNVFDVETSISPVKDVSGKTTNYVCVQRDVSQEKELEERLRQTQIMEAIGTLAGGVAHDFNNILSAIFGFTDLAQKETRDHPKASDYLDQVRQAATRAKGLVQQVLAFSRKSEATKHSLILSSLIKDVTGFLKASFPSTIEIHEQFIAKNAEVTADPDQIHQVLMNLCTNAGHAMKNTGGSLTISLTEEDVTEEDPVLSSGKGPGRYLKLTVTDTGHGIEKELLGKIFEPYITTMKKGEGTGLGLSVVHGIVENHGGFIKVQSEINKGTRFDVFFPLLKAGSRPDEKTDPEIIPTGTKSILYVDDEEALVLAGKNMFEDLGYQVTGATSPEEALAEFNKNKDTFDLVITDKTMPKMTGFDLAEELLKIRPEIPIILSTGRTEEGDRNRAKRIGIKSILLKPLDLKSLVRTVRNNLDKPAPVQSLDAAEVSARVAALPPDLVKQMGAAAAIADIGPLSDCINRIRQDEPLLAKFLGQFLERYDYAGIESALSGEGKGES